MWKKILTVLITIYKNWHVYWQQFLTIIGNIKIYKTPCFIQYSKEEYDYKVRGNVIREINNLLQPGDIVLRHYDNYLDSFLIPGYYSHSSIYIGDNKIIHAVAEGVKEIDVIDFCQCDGICVLRPIKEQSKAIEFAKNNLGKAYDFKFNTEDSSEFYCHELVANCYKDLNIKAFPIIFGDKDIKFLKPRYLAESFLENENFEKIFENRN